MTLACFAGTPGSMQLSLQRSVAASGSRLAAEQMRAATAEQVAAEREQPGWVGGEGDPSGSKVAGSPPTPHSQLADRHVGSNQAILADLGGGVNDRIALPAWGGAGRRAVGLECVMGRSALCVT